MQPASNEREVPLFARKQDIPKSVRFERDVYASIYF